MQGISAITLGLLIANTAALQAQPNPTPPASCATMTEQEKLTALLGKKDFRNYVETEFATKLADNPYVIAYDHVYDRWAVYRMKTNNPVLLEPYKAEATPSGDTYKLELPSNSEAVVFLTRSNPLLFRANAKAVTEEDSADVETLKKFAALAANFLTGFTTTLGSRNARAIAQPTIAMNEPELTAFSTNAKAAIDKLATALHELNRVVTDVSTHNDEVVAYTQMVELGGNFSSSLPSPTDLRSDAVKAQEVFDGARSAANQVRQVLQPYCADIVTQARAALAVYTAADYESTTAKRDAAVHARDAAVQSGKPQSTIDTIQSKIDDLEDALNKADTDVNKLQLSGACTGRSLSLWQDLKREIPSGGGAAAFKVVADTADAVAAAEELLAKEPATLKVAGWLGDFADVVAVYDSSAQPSACSFIDQPIVVRAGSFTPSAGKKQSGGFTISSTLDTTTMHLKHPAAIDRKIEVSSASKWGLGAGLVYSTDKLNSWSLVDKDGGKVIGRVKRETFAGQTGLFANFHPGAWTAGPAKFGGQLGFATDTAKPAILLGPSLDLGKWLRIGGGYGFHKNKRLAKGEVEGQAPTDGGTDVRTRDYFSGGFYVSLSLSLDGIPLFSAP